MARYISSGGVKYIGGDDAPIGFSKDTDRVYLAEIDGQKYALEKRNRNVADGCHDTGWYLYGGDSAYFGVWCARRILDAVVAANEIILSQSN